MTIPNHRSAKLSQLDLSIVQSIPPGGNWKDVPTSIGAKRLETIRASYARGEGSRSTYYGRLRPEAPSYTINTYYSRPGNGCHIHYAFDRVITAREAARFQSFPDSFEFIGAQSHVSKQIGNAVPPLLAYHVARTLGPPGLFVDLFAGAGGLSLGFLLAGWTPLVANDSDAWALKTYSANVHDEVVLGDIRDPIVSASLIKAVRSRKSQMSGVPLIVIGGPPCQGFSTAGKRRTMDDERNHLFKEYRAIVDSIGADGFVFENVMGLLNMNGGKVFQEVCDVLSEDMNDLQANTLGSVNFGVPQRRRRVFVTAFREAKCPPPPTEFTEFPQGKERSASLAIAPGALEAIGDLPLVNPGEDASHKRLREVGSDFQRMCRGMISFEEYSRGLEGNCRGNPDLPLALPG